MPSDPTPGPYEKGLTELCGVIRKLGGGFSRSADDMQRQMAECTGDREALAKRLFDKSMAFFKVIKAATGGR